MSAEFENALQNIESSYREGLKCFCEWLSKNWKMDSNDNWPNQESLPSDEFRKGWDTAISEIQGALDCFLDEHNN